MIGVVVVCVDGVLFIGTFCINGVIDIVGIVWSVSV